MNLELDANRRAKLVLFKILEYAETGGMNSTDCGTTYTAISNCLDANGDLTGLIEQIEILLRAKEWADNRDRGTDDYWVNAYKA